MWCLFYLAKPAFQWGMFSLSVELLTSQRFAWAGHFSFSDLHLAPDSSDARVLPLHTSQLLILISGQTFRCRTSSLRCLCTGFPYHLWMSYPSDNRQWYFYLTTWGHLIFTIFVCRYVFFPAARWHISSGLIACWYCDERKLAHLTAYHASEQEHNFTEVWLIVGNLLGQK